MDLDIRFLQKPQNTVFEKLTLNNLYKKYNFEYKTLLGQYCQMKFKLQGALHYTNLQPIVQHLLKLAKRLSKSVFERNGFRNIPNFWTMSSLNRQTDFYRSYLKMLNCCNVLVCVSKTLDFDFMLPDGAHSLIFQLFDHYNFKKILRFLAKISKDYCESLFWPKAQVL